MRQRIAAALVLVSALTLLGAASASGDRTLKCFGEHATIVGSGLITGTEGDDVIVGSDGADTINALGGDDLVCALGGNDLSRGGLGDDHMDGGEGNDGHLGDVNADLPGTDLPGGNDVIIGGPGDDSAAGDHRAFSGPDITGNGGDDLFIGGPGDDFFFGDSIGDGTISGRGGNDRALLGDGRDAAIGDHSAIDNVGDAGDDYLDGGGAMTSSWSGTRPGPTCRPRSMGHLAMTVSSGAAETMR